MDERYHRVVGIDLGTTCCAVAVFDALTEKAVMVADESEGGSPATPSAVALDSQTHRTHVGHAAMRSAGTSPDPRPVIEIKRELGEVFTEQSLLEFEAQSVYEIGQPVRVLFAGEWRRPQEIAALILMRMKRIAEHRLKGEILDAVVSVPACFTEPQRQATAEAARLAGLNPRQLIVEPVAAALSYGRDQLADGRKTLMVYDLGGGTFDVSIIEVGEDCVQVLGSAGDPRLGGADFDDSIGEWAAEQLMRHRGVDVRALPAGRERLRALAERAKIELSQRPETRMDLTEFCPRQPFEPRLSRGQFEALIDEQLRGTIARVDEAIDQAEDVGLLRSEIDAILLVGGSCRIPLVPRILLEHFGKDESFIVAVDDPHTAVARGAAVVAHGFSPSPPPFDPARPDTTLRLNPDADDEPRLGLIAEQDLGIGVHGERMHRVINRGSELPASQSQGGYTNAGPSTTMQVRIYQGSHEWVYENSRLGTLHIGPFEPAPMGTYAFEVTYSLDRDGLLTATVREVNEGRDYPATIERATEAGGREELLSLREGLVKLMAPDDRVTSEAG